MRCFRTTSETLLGVWWQRAGGFTPYNRIDHVEAVLQLCERVQQTMAPVVTWFPEIPYVAFGSGIRKRDLNRAAGMIIKELIKIEKDPKNTALVEHLMSTDVWRQSLELEYPETRQVTADPLEDCTKAVSCLDDIQDIVNEGGHGEYRKSMEAIGELHKKFSGRGVGKKDSAMKLGAYIDKHLRACEPAKARIDAWLNQMAPTINEARHIENFLNGRVGGLSGISTGTAGGENQNPPCCNHGCTGAGPVGRAATGLGNGSTCHSCP